MKASKNKRILTSVIAIIILLALALSLGSGSLADDEVSGSAPEESIAATTDTDSSTEESSGEEVSEAPPETPPAPSAAPASTPAGMSGAGTDSLRAAPRPADSTVPGAAIAASIRGLSAAIAAREPSVNYWNTANWGTIRSNIHTGAGAITSHDLGNVHSDFVSFLSFTTITNAPNTMIINANDYTTVRSISMAVAANTLQVNLAGATVNLTSSAMLDVRSGTVTTSTSLISPKVNGTNAVLNANAGTTGTAVVTSGKFNATTTVNVTLNSGEFKPSGAISGTVNWKGGTITNAAMVTGILSVEHAFTISSSSQLPKISTVVIGTSGSITYSGGNIQAGQTVTIPAAHTADVSVGTVYGKLINESVATVKINTVEVAPAAFENKGVTNSSVYKNYVVVTTNKGTITQDTNVNTGITTNAPGANLNVSITSTAVYVNANAGTIDNSGTLIMTDAAKFPIASGLNWPDNSGFVSSDNTGRILNKKTLSLQKNSGTGFVEHHQTASTTIATGEQSIGLAHTTAGKSLRFQDGAAGWGWTGIINIQGFVPPMGITFEFNSAAGGTIANVNSGQRVLITADSNNVTLGTLKGEVDKIGGNGILTINNNYVKINNGGTAAIGGNTDSTVSGGTMHIGTNYAEADRVIYSNNMSGTVTTNNGIVESTSTGLLTVTTNNNEVYQTSGTGVVNIGTNNKKAESNNGAGAMNITVTSKTTNGIVNYKASSFGYVEKNEGGSKVYIDSSNISAATSPAVIVGGGAKPATPAKAVLVGVNTGNGSLVRSTSAAHVQVTTNDAAAKIEMTGSGSLYVNSNTNATIELTGTGIADVLLNSGSAVINQGATNATGQLYVSNNSATINHATSDRNTPTRVLTNSGNGKVDILAGSNGLVCVATNSAVAPNNGVFVNSAQSAGNLRVVVGGSDNGAFVNPGVNTGHVRINAFSNDVTVYNATNNDTAASGHIVVTAGAGEFHGSGLIEVSGANDSNSIGKANMPTFTGAQCVGAPHIKMSGTGRLGLTNVNANPTKIEGVTGAHGYKLYFDPSFNGSDDAAQNNPNAGSINGNGYHINFLRYEGAMHKDAEANPGRGAIPSGVQVLNLDATPIDYTEQWATIGAVFKKVKMTNAGTTSLDLIYKNATTGFYPTGTKNTRIGVGIDELIAKEILTITFNGTESSAAGAVLGMNLGGTGNNGHFRMDIANAATSVTIGYQTVAGKGVTPAFQTNFPGGVNTQYTVNMRSVEVWEGVKNFTSYENDLQAVIKERANYVMDSMKLYDKYSALPTVPSLFNSRAVNTDSVIRMGGTTSSITNLEIGMDDGDTKSIKKATTAVEAVPLTPNSFRLDYPLIRNVTFHGIQNANVAEIFLSPDAAGPGKGTNTVSFKDGYATTHTPVIKMYGSSALSNATAPVKNISFELGIGAAVHTLDLKYPADTTIPPDNQADVLEVGGALAVAEKLTNVPMIQGWSYDATTISGTIVEKVLDMRDNNIKNIGANFSGTTENNGAGTLLALHQHIGTGGAGNTQQYINKLDVRGNQMTLVNLSHGEDNKYLTELRHKRGNGATMKYLNLSGTNAIVEGTTYNRTPSTNLPSGGGDTADNDTFDKLEYVWYDNVRQLSTNAGLTPTAVYTPAVYTNRLGVLDLRENRINEFSIASIPTSGVTPGHGVVSIDLSYNQIKAVDNTVNATFGNGSGFGSGAVGGTANHSNINFGFAGTKTDFNIDAAVGEAYLDLSHQGARGAGAIPGNNGLAANATTNSYLISVKLDNMVARDIKMNNSVNLDSVTLSNFNRGTSVMKDFYKTSLTGCDVTADNKKGSVEPKLAASLPAQDYPTLYEDTLSTSATVNVGPEDFYRQAVNSKITYLSFENSTAIHAPVSLGAGGALPARNVSQISPFSVVNNGLKTVNYKGCSQLDGSFLELYGNEIENIDLRGTKTANGIQNIDLASNRIKTIDFTNPAVSNLKMDGATGDVDYSLIVSWNPIERVNISGSNMRHIDTSFAAVKDTSNAYNATSYYDATYQALNGRLQFPIKGGVTAEACPKLEAVDITGNVVYNLNLKNSTEVREINGTRNVSNPSGTATGNNGGNAAPLSNSALVVGTLNLTGINKLDVDVLDFRGHHIHTAVLDNINAYETINLKRNDALGETRADFTGTVPDVFDEFEQGVLKNVSLVSSNVTALDFDENSIITVDSRQASPAQTDVYFRNTTFVASAAIPNPIVKINFNQVRTFIMTRDGQNPGFAGLHTVELNNNKLKDLEASELPNLEFLIVNRYIHNRTGRSLASDRTNLYNSFEGGSVVLRNSPKLKYFGPATTLEVDRALDYNIIRKIPVEPNEHQWPSNATKTAGEVGHAAVSTTITSQQSIYYPNNMPPFATGKGASATDWGYYSQVPIVKFDAIGCTALETVRIPGNRLTAGNFLLDGSAGNLKYLDISGAESTKNGTVNENYLPTPSRTRGLGSTTPVGTTLDSASGKFGGSFEVKWPKLEVLRIQNNQITELHTSTADGSLLEVLAQNNKLSNLQISSLRKVLYVDVERNLLSNITVPTASMEIFRAGQNKLKSLPNVHDVRTLRQIYLNHNNLSGVYPDVNRNPNLQVLNVAYNSFIEIEFTQRHAKLEELYAYHNLIEKFWGFDVNANKLAIADLSENLIMMRLDMPDSLQYLDVSYNIFSNVIMMGTKVPAAMANTTPYNTIAHEVYTSHDKEYGRDDGFVGTLNISENLITGLPEDLHNAWMEFAAKNPGKPIANFILKYNILDIDIYDIETPGPIPINKGQQKWLSVAPEYEFVMLVKMDLRQLYDQITPALRLYHPAKNFYQLPNDYHTYHFWWDADMYSEYVSLTHLTILQNGFVTVNARMDGTGTRENGSRNAMVSVLVRVVDWHTGTKFDLESNNGSLINGDTGAVTKKEDEDDKNYNPNTGQTREESEE